MKVPSPVGSIFARLRAYLANPDPLAAAASTVAVVVAFNQPFYPLYLHAIAGAAAWPAWGTLLSLPLFGAVPAVARRHSLAGRAMLPLAGVANTMLGVKLLGIASAVELFLFPCVLLGAILFRPAERTVMVIVLAAPFVAYLGLDGMLAPPVGRFGADVYASMAGVNAMSVAALTALIGLLFAALLSERRV